MNNERNSKPNNMIGLLRSGIALIVLFAVLAAAVTVDAWLYYGRTIVAISEISNPTVIGINSGNREDVRYINLGRIDVTAPDDPESASPYKDFVFCINGINIEYYKLQLAYTTNNQFEYEIYPAALWDGTGSAPAASVLYTVNVGASAGTDQYYYISGSKIAGTIKNLDTAAYNDAESEIRALSGDTYHDLTYEDYTNRHKYAIPLYWQSNGSFDGSTGEFCNYYVLRVIWTSGSKNTKETDIIYISAKNTAELSTP